jgi:2-C-methyl-D-erythritol 4-phosphate cytidylyltransferase
LAIAILLAAGKGLRFSKELPKQFYLYRGKQLLSYSLETLLQISEVQKVVLVTDVDSQQHLSQIKILKKNQNKVEVVHGGKTRSDSIRLGLEVALSLATQNRPVVLLHDSSRPFVSKSHFEKVLASSGLKDAVVTRTSLQDAYAVQDIEGNFELITDRSLVTFQTPISLSNSAAEKLLGQFGSELKFGVAGLLIQLGFNIDFVESDGSTRKVTFMHDIAQRE